MFSTDQAENDYQNGKKLVENSDLNFEAGKILLKQAAAAGHSDAAFLLAKIYLDEFGEKRNFSLGLKYLKIAIKRKHQEARLFYAELLLYENEYLEIKPDKNQALELIDILIAENYLKAVLKKLRLSSDFYQEKEIDKQFNQYLATVDPKTDLDFETGLYKTKQFSAQGSIEATKTAIDFYSNPHKCYANNVSTEEAKYLIKLYRLKLEKLQAAATEEKKASDLFLLEKASSLGDADSSLDLAILYLGRERWDISLSQDVDKAMYYLHLSLDQGNSNAALTLAGIYFENDTLGDTDTKTPSFIAHLKNPAKVLAALEAGAKNNGKFIQSRCALKLAQYYRFDVIKTESLEQRRDKMMFYYELSASLGNDKAKTALVALYLVGQSNLLLKPSIEDSNSLLNKMDSSEMAYMTAQEIARIGDNSTLHVEKYLFCLFRSIELRYPISDPLKDLAYLLTKSVALCSYDREGQLLARPNAALANQWNNFLEEQGEYNSDDDFNDEKIPALFQSQEYQQLVKATYSHLGLECPFSFESKEENITPVKNPSVSDNRYMQKRFEQQTIAPSDNNNEVSKTEELFPPKP